MPMSTPDDGTYNGGVYNLFNGIGTYNFADPLPTRVTVIKARFAPNIKIEVRYG